jgi:hypothetical protein
MTPGRWAQLKYRGYRFLMPTWGSDELEDYYRSAYFPENGISVETARARSAIFGGAIRSIISQAVEIRETGIYCPLIESELKGDIIVQFVHYFFDCGFGKEVSDVLVHRNPPKSETTGAVDYEGAESYEFASTYVFRKIFRIHKEVLLTKAREKFSVGEGL